MRVCGLTIRLTPDSYAGDLFARAAKIANQLFGGVRFGKRLSRNNNFETTWEALLAMFVVVTGDEWQAMMRDVGVHGDSCTQWGPTGNAGLFGYSGDPPGSVGMEWLIKNGYQKYFTDPNFGMSDCGDRVTLQSLASDFLFISSIPPIFFSCIPASSTSSPSLPSALLLSLLSLT